MKHFLSIVFIIISFYSFYHNYTSNSIKSNTKNNWIKTTGKITKVKLLREEIKKSNILNYYVSISYQYNVNNTNYTGKATEFLYSSKKTIGDIELIDNKYKNGMEIDVFYNKFDLNTSVMNDNLLQQNYLGYIYGTIFLVTLFFINM